MVRFPRVRNPRGRMGNGGTLRAFTRARVKSMGRSLPLGQKECEGWARAVDPFRARTWRLNANAAATSMKCYLQKHLGDAWTNSVPGSCQDIVVGNLRLELE